MYHAIPRINVLTSILVDHDAPSVAIRTDPRRHRLAPWPLLKMVPLKNDSNVRRGRFHSVQANRRMAGAHECYRPVYIE